MRFWFFVSTFFYCFLVAAQADSLTYYIVKKDSQAMYCKITGQYPGFLTVLKDNGKNDTVLNAHIEKHYVIDGKGNLIDIKKITRGQWKEIVNERTKIEQAKAWDSCFIITINKDTLRGRVETARDYTNSEYGHSNLISLPFFDWLENKIHFRNEGGKEIFFSDKEIEKMFVFNRPQEYSWYISSVDDWDTYRLYRLIVDGKCQLMAAMVKVEVSIRPEFNSKTGLFTSPNTIGINQSYFTEDYFINYKNIATHITPTTFKSKCRELFSACPLLVQKIEDRTYTIQNFNQIVTEFNQCLEEKK